LLALLLLSLRTALTSLLVALLLTLLAGLIHRRALLTRVLAFGARGLAGRLTWLPGRRCLAVTLGLAVCLRRLVALLTLPARRSGWSLALLLALSAAGRSGS
jgi:hypothetical protein